MLPIFHMNNFKPWAPPRKKPFSPHKSLNSPSPRTQNAGHRKPYHDSPSSTLSVPKHHLPARPPAEVCMHISGNIQLSAPASSQSQHQEMSPSEADMPLENPRRCTTFLHESTPPIPNPDPLPCRDLQGDSSVNDSNMPIEPPPFRGDFVEDSLSSPSLSNSGDSLEEFFRLPDPQGGIPIDPVILASGRSQEGADLWQPAPRADSLMNSEMMCSYPDPPTVLRHLSENDQDSSEGLGCQNDSTQTTCHPEVRERQPLHHPQYDTDTSVFYPDHIHGKRHVGGQSRGSKWKTRESDRRHCKRLQVPSARPARRDSFTALRSHFVSLPLDERLQFLSWLFEGALPRCMSGSLPTNCEDGDTLVMSPSKLTHDMNQNRRDCREAQASLSKRKCNKWSTEEMDLLRKLKQDDSRPWSEVARLLSEQYPGRSPGAIQVFWSTKLNKKTD